MRDESKTAKWWREDDGKVADALVSHFDAIERQQSTRNRAYKRNLRLYQGRMGLPGRASDAYIVGHDGKMLSLNVVASILRSLRAKIVKNRPAPWVLTDGGTLQQQTAAEQMQQFLEGAIYETGTYAVMARAFDIAGICGECDVKVYPDFEAKRVRVEACYPWETPVDDQDGYYGAPRARYQRGHIDRDVLLQSFPDHEEAIRKLDSSKGDPDFGFDGQGADQVKTVEAWRLPNGEASKDGRHVWAVPGAGLIVEPWELPRFPLARLMLEPEPVGFHGVGVCDELAGLQLEINETLTKIQEGHQSGGHAMLLVEAGAKVNKSKLTNGLHSIVEYTGTPPQAVVIPAVSPETYNWVWSLVSRAYEIYGISQLSAQAQKPVGLDSGRALRTYHDIESERFSYVARSYEALLLDICELIIDAATQLADDSADFAVRYRSAEELKRIRWNEINLDRDAYVMQVQPKSYLADAGPGRVQSVQEQISVGNVDPRAARSLLRSPDLKAYPDPWEASFRLARKQVDDILRAGVVAQCESYQDLQTALQVGLDAYNRARSYTDVPIERLDLLRSWINAVEKRLEPPPPSPLEAMPPQDATAPVPPELAPAPALVPPAAE